jgi:hypothetical protein
VLLRRGRSSENCSRDQPCRLLSSLQKGGRQHVAKRRGKAAPTSSPPARHSWGIAFLSGTTYLGDYKCSPQTFSVPEQGFHIFLDIDSKLDSRTTYLGKERRNSTTYLGETCKVNDILGGFGPDQARHTWGKREQKCDILGEKEGKKYDTLGGKEREKAVWHSRDLFRLMLKSSFFTSI